MSEWGFPEVEVKEQVEVKEKAGHSLILFNDEVNTFDFVIQCLIEVCDHELNQAEQCTYLVHYKGKCDVKSGSWEKLEPMCTELLRRGLSAEIS